jgi:tRNA (mo5U34)-methyltransferase
MTGGAADRRPRDIEALGPWFHNLHLPGGLQTAPSHPLGDFPAFKWAALAPHLPEDLTGWTALDVGCNAGFYTIELARRGARVTGIDMDPHYLAQARWAVAQLGLADRVTLRRMQVYRLASLPGRFDLVLFMGVLYHLRHPLLGLDLVARKVGRLLVFQSLLLPGDAVATPPEDRALDDRDLLADPGWPALAFVEGRFAGDPTNWWVPNRAAAEAMLRSAGLAVVARPEREIFVCTPAKPSQRLGRTALGRLSAPGRRPS